MLSERMRRKCWPWWEEVRSKECTARVLRIESLEDYGIKKRIRDASRKAM